MKIEFTHIQYSTGRRGVFGILRPLNTPEHRAITFCKITDDLGKIHKGCAKCSWEDNFNKETGRRLALVRATKSFSKEERSIIHEKYDNREFKFKL